MELDVEGGTCGDLGGRVNRSVARSDKGEAAGEDAPIGERPQQLIECVKLLGLAVDARLEGARRGACALGKAAAASGHLIGNRHGAKPSRAKHEIGAASLDIYRERPAFPILEISDAFAVLAQELDETPKRELPGAPLEGKAMGACVGDKCPAEPAA